LTDEPAGTRDGLAARSRADGIAFDDASRFGYRLLVTAAVLDGRTVNPAFSMFGRQYVAAVALKAVLATMALGLAVLQVLLALWIYRKLPLAGS
jgi:hypothetical protein